MLVTHSNQTPIVKYSNTIAGEHDAMRERDAAGERYRAGEPDRMDEEGAILCRSESHLIKTIWECIGLRREDVIRYGCGA